MPAFQPKIEEEISRFRSLCRDVLPKKFVVESVCSDGIVLSPKGEAQKKQAKAIDLTILGIIHGNEWGGCGVLNRFLELLVKDVIPLKASVAFILGNPEAALKNIRFSERDLNRSFDREDQNLFEEKRADEIEEVLKETSFLLDIHQTREPSLTPFFISPFTKKSFRFAAEISSDFPIVTHWGKPFSPEGRCTDDFVNQNGGAGMTLELGQNGLDLRQIATGTLACVSALHSAEHSLGFRPAAQEKKSIKNPIFTWAQQIPCDDPESYVDPGFINFAPLKKGQRIGAIRNKVVTSEVDGCILFPKYNDHNQANHKATATMDFCRVMKQIQLSDLPESV